MSHNGRNRAGEGKDFEEYFSDSNDPIISGEHNEVQYRVYKQSTGTKDGIKDSHYTGYIRLSDITEDWENVYIDNLPSCPGHNRVSFGPTIDGWIGFGTMDSRDHNYTEDMAPFEADHRMTDEEVFGDESIYYFTPEIIHSSVLEWIVDIGEHLGEWEIREPNTDQYEPQYNE